MECLATGFGLIEGPVWDAGAGLYFSDAVGGMALHGGDGLVMGGRDIAVVRLADGKTSPLLSLSQLPGTTGFNDLTVDATGRVYVGSLTFRVFSGDTPTPGFLQRINLDGTLRPWRPFATFGGHGTPDGMKVAVDGSVWVAVAHAGIVRVFNADGSHRRDIEIPLPLVTSLCFGGDDLRDLYVVTGSKGGPSDRCGSIYRIRSDVSGVPMHAAKVRI